MNIKVTSRHFKAHDALNDYAMHAVEGLAHYYDGITRADVVLTFEKVRNSTKIAEVSLKVYKEVLSGEAKGEEFEKAIDTAVAKVRVQLTKYKEKMHKKDREKVRAIRAKE
jgi:putative sigma-54 modulation protein